MTAFRASLALLSGVLAGAYLHIAWLFLSLGLLAASCLLLPEKGKKQRIGAALILILAGFYFHAYDAAHRSSLLAVAAEERSVLAIGTIDSSVKRDGDSARFFLRVQLVGETKDTMQELLRSERIALRVKLSDETEAVAVETWLAGDQLMGRLHLGLPSGPRNPHAFDYAQYLRWQGVAVTAEAAFGELEQEVGKGGMFSLFQKWQSQAAKRVERVFGDSEVAGYMNSLLLGVTDRVTPETRELYTDLGLSHVLAISGLHVTLVSGMFLWAIERIGVPRKMALFCTIAMLAGYVLIVGASASAVRAGMMGGLGLFLQTMARKLDGKDLWGWALMVMLIANPYQLWHIGFQLSFAVTLGLLLFVPIIQQWIPYGPGWLRASLSVTIAAEGVSFPFLVYHFHQSSSVSWLVNLLAVPILSLVVLPAGYIALLLSLIHPALSILPASTVAWTLENLHAPLFRLQAAHVPFSYWPHPPWWWMSLYAGFLSLLPILWKVGYHRSRDKRMYVLTLIGLLVLARQPFTGADEVRITFLDVGQGDSIVVEIGKRKVYLIDAGGTPAYPNRELWREKRDPFEVGKDVVAPFLRARGIERIDYVVMTHGDHDHIGGVEALIPRFAIGAAMVNGSPPRDKEKEIFAHFDERQIPILTGRPGHSWSDAPDVEWRWLHPDGSSAHTGNDASIVLALTAYGKTVLFTGDLEESGENHLLSGELLASVDVLKVAHHGSKTSSTEGFLAAIEPKCAVISVGQKNRYGHPSLAVLTRLQETGAEIYRTDLQGAVTLVIRKDSFQWKTQIHNL
ncbi:DNA internalization-related competence protein ComEC/Rec2 [Brevibacillus ruminantium]|uniref:DNA internalization-related competence protein ComEC/Rec2 n=1 Tax=Brevibacillus ruminantium TaxID=2950604 RepID=A0ABY4WCL9_9BACL|nr:DNA internalization-related competence protein ComEC/Rec2 [Brevibacillus ruminantium]USG63908.1 DNA internalization-related competence protein ComEC/Rec2 [Brevibacillus ruminantium]